ncbi:hypothetical protein HW555_005603 [Spodoptera exigua]|uniref:DUF4802 domain-containing protein n=1 Tax=Spodoptera exigua TaxID=7107 RepID=A0A835GIU9_SPOEX|nr:hypothetical protein HW555_005603 [Spodoptera exigua]
MAPVKFGLFKARSRDYQEQPSTENLLHTSHSSDHLGTPSSPIPSTSKGMLEDTASADLSVLNIDSEDDDTISQQNIITRRVSDTSKIEESQINYQPLKNQASADATSMSTLNSDQEDHETTLVDDGDGASTSCDVLSLQFDETSIAASEDLSVYCGTLKKTKKIRSKEEKQLRDLDMWQASNVEVMQNLLSRSGTLDDQIKWEAIATARGLCTLKDSCTCDDCVRAKYLAGVTDGDGGLGAAPLFNAISVGCIVQ